MNFFKFLFMGNFLFISFNLFILARYYFISSRLFAISGLLFFKLLIRLLIFNIFIYFGFNLQNKLPKDDLKQINQIVLVSNDFEFVGISDNQVDKIINYVSREEKSNLYSLSVFNPTTFYKGVLVPSTSRTVFLNSVQKIDLNKLRPLYYSRFLPSNFSTIKNSYLEVFVIAQNKLIDLAVGSKNNLFLSSENSYSINLLTIYLLILLLFLFVFDASLKFQILK